MMSSVKAPIALLAVLALSAACSSSVGPQTGASSAPADVHVAMPGYKNSKEALGLGQPPIAPPADPVIKPASVTFASSREFQEFPLQPVTNSIFLDAGTMAPASFGKTRTVAVPQRKMIPTQYREVVMRTGSTAHRSETTVYASTFGDLLVE